MRLCLVITLLVGCCLSGCLATENTSERKNYDGYKVLEVVPSDRATVNFLRNMMLKEENVDFWTEPSKVGKSVQFMVSPERRPAIIRQLENADIAFNVLINNLQEKMEPVWREIDGKDRLTKRVFDIDDFNTYTDITGWMRALVPLCRADVVCEVVRLGLSWNGNSIDSFRISKEGSNRKAYYIDSTTHAREWISTATTLKILNALALGTSAEAIRLVDEFDWHIVPIVNPDGYIYTWTNDRMWRKNRKANGSCIGTDLNRNFDHEWGTEGTSHSPCSNTFCGTSPASEPETQVIQTELRRLSPTLKAVVTIHSYGNMWLFPWGFTVDHAGEVCQRTSDHDDLMRVSELAANAVEDTYDTSWLRGNGCEEIYPTTGSTDDYAKGRAGIKYAFTLELRGDSFVINKSEITPSFTEVWNGLVKMVDAIV